MSFIYVDDLLVASNQNSFTQQVLLDGTIQTQYNYLKFL